MNSQSVENDSVVRAELDTKSDLPTKSVKDLYSAPDQDGPVRPIIKPFTHQSAFYPGDKVYIKATAASAREGPYLIDKALDNEKYLLSHLNGTTAKEGVEVKGGDLEEAD